MVHKVYRFNLVIFEAILLVLNCIILIDIPIFATGLYINEKLEKPPAVIQTKHNTALNSLLRTFSKRFNLNSVQNYSFLPTCQNCIKILNVTVMSQLAAGTESTKQDEQGPNEKTGT